MLEVDNLGDCLVQRIIVDIPGRDMKKLSIGDIWCGIGHVYESDVTPLSYEVGKEGKNDK
jgi:hypothetical protein